MVDWEKHYWNTRYSTGGNSGAGSYGDSLKRKLELIGELKDIKSISEYGCGDFNFGFYVTRLFPESSYTGNDISPFIVETNTHKFPRYSFTLEEELPPADLVLCVDVLLHVMEDEEVEKLLQNIERTWTKYLVITAYEYDEKKTNHVRIRKFDYQRFGEPIVREVTEAEGSMYMYIWKK